MEVSDLTVKLPLSEKVLFSEIGFEIFEGEVLGIVGQSGCGKTVLSRTLLALRNYPVIKGEILFHLDGRSYDLVRVGNKVLRRLRRDLQLIFQNPSTSLNPKLKVGTVLTEVGINLLGLQKSEALKKALEILSELFRQDEVALEELLDKRSHELSQGQQQRVAICRAIMSNPKLLIADEPTSSLDPKLKAETVELLLRVKKLYGNTLVFISHDIDLVRRISDRVMIIYPYSNNQSSKIIGIFSPEDLPSNEAGIKDFLAKFGIQNDEYVSYIAKLMISSEKFSGG